VPVIFWCDTEGVAAARDGNSIVGVDEATMELAAVVVSTNDFKDSQLP
jgi:hypothetical protein